jgi:hypothetical protein
MASLKTSQLTFAFPSEDILMAPVNAFGNSVETLSSGVYTYTLVA